jgi:hypothetical protein
VGDGRHTDYLKPTAANERDFRNCDLELYDCLAKIVKRKERCVAAFPRQKILPSQTVFHAPILTYDGLPLAQRTASRTAWIEGALQATKDCDFIMFDPDNGLEVTSCGKYGRKGTKYVFFDELAPYVSRGQTIIVYQHGNRDGSLEEQTQERLGQLQDKLGLETTPFALLWRRVSARSFLIAPAREHATYLEEQTNNLLSGPLARLLTRVPGSP